MQVDGEADSVLLAGERERDHLATLVHDMRLALEAHDVDANAVAAPPPPGSDNGSGAFLRGSTATSLRMGPAAMGKLNAKEGWKYSYSGPKPTVQHSDEELALRQEISTLQQDLAAAERRERLKEEEVHALHRKVAAQDAELERLREQIRRHHRR